jgi:hypothetical protein
LNHFELPHQPSETVEHELVQTGLLRLGGVTMLYDTRQQLNRLASITLLSPSSQTGLFQVGLMVGLDGDLALEKEINQSAPIRAAQMRKDDSNKISNTLCWCR